MNTSTANTKTKPSRVRVSYVHIKFKNRDNWQPMYIHESTEEKELKSIEKYLMKHQNAWKYAALKEFGTNAVIHYYHPNMGVEHLDLERYKEQFTAYSLYIVHTSSYKRRTGKMKGDSQRIYDLDQIDKYWNKDVLRILVYVNGKKINTYENGRFLK